MSFHKFVKEHIKYPDSSSRSGGQIRKPSAGSNQPPQGQLTNQNNASLQNGIRATSPSIVEGDGVRRATSPTYPIGSSLSNGHVNGQIGDLMTKETHVNIETHI